MKLLTNQLRGVWFAMTIVAVALVVYDGQLRLQQNNYVGRIVELRDRTAQAESLARDYQKARSTVSQNYDAENAIDDRLTRMLRGCASREEFVVREGPRIVWSELRGGTDDAVRIGLYLPAGRHRLRYAYYDVAKMRVQREVVADSGRSRFTVTTGKGQDQKEFRTGDVRTLPGSNGCELEGPPQTYEITLTAPLGETLTLGIRAGDSLPPRDLRMDLNFGPSEFRANVTKNAFAFPSEVKLVAGLPPATDIGFITVHEKGTKREADIRLWIESDSPPCISAIEVAANYMALGDWEAGRFPVVIKLHQEQTAADIEFKRLFLPYDGSDRLYLREELVADKFNSP